MTTLYGHAALSELTSNAPDYEELEEGHSAKYNHATCSMGVDTRKRFGVKHVDDAYLWHCFNCGYSGYYRPKETTSRMKLMGAKATLLRTGVKDFGEIHASARSYYNDFDIRGQLWLAQYGLTAEECFDFRIREYKEGIILPIWYGGMCVGYQVRRYDKQPKYLTYNKDNNIQWLLTGTGNKTLVIVEDLLSSYKLSMAGYASLCLLGTKLNKSHITNAMLDTYDRVVIWLDDDEAGHFGAMTLFRELSPTFKVVTSMNMAQAKEINIESLKEMEL